MLNRQRPVNLDLRTLKYPLMAIASILHRLSGIVLFLLLPFVLYLFSQSLQSAVTFDVMMDSLACPYYKLFVWAFMSALFYHILAGLRHLAMDMGWGEYLPAGRYTAGVVVVLGVLYIMMLGVYLW